MLLKVSGISKQVGEDFVLQGISFGQHPLQKIAIAGATGAGKTTLLKIIGGRAQADSGEVLFENKKVPGLAEKLLPGHPGIAYLSQHFELRNNYRVEEELAYTNELSDKKAAVLYEVCRIGHLLQRKTDQLSGGERQRIALARLLTASPRLLLLDEPFSNLDPDHKNNLKTVIRDIGEKLRITCILVSHDPLDTLSWADEILVLQDGQLRQKGSPEQVYRQPVNEYTAGLFGKYNLIDPVHAAAFPGIPVGIPGGKNLLIRPGQFTVVTEENTASRSAEEKAVKGIVAQVRFLGSFYEVEVLLQGFTITVSTPVGQIANRGRQIAKGDTVYILLDPENVWYV